MRFGIRPMLLAVLALAAGLGAIVSNSTLVAGATLLLGCALWGLAVVGLLIGQGRSRVFCAGFTVFAGMYGFVFWDEIATAADVASASASATSRAIDWLAHFRSSPPSVGDVVSAKWPNNGRNYPAQIIDYDPDGDVYLVAWNDGSSPSWLASTRMQTVSHHVMLRTGHVVVAILLGALGGLLSCACFAPATVRPSANEGATERPR
jgi:hypothetical protein